MRALLLSLVLLCFFAVPASAADIAWPPKAPKGWVIMGQFGPTVVKGCEGDASLLPPMWRAVCEGTANQFWTALFTNFGDFDPTTGSAPSLSMAVYLDVSEDGLEFYCGKDFVKEYDPSVGFSPVSEAELPAKIAACFDR